jgi:hypothetical protein
MIQRWKPWRGEMPTGPFIGDCRSYDIPETIAAMIRNAAPNCVAVTLRALGGERMTAAAERAARIRRRHRPDVDRLEAHSSARTEIGAAGCRNGNVHIAASGFRPKARAMPISRPRKTADGSRLFTRANRPTPFAPIQPSTDSEP